MTGIGSVDFSPTESQPKVKTTKAHFRLFKKYFMEYIRMYGLNEWRFDIVHGDCGDAYSTVNQNTNGKVVTVCFNSIWWDHSGLPGPDEEAIRKTAKHEANEMLVGDLASLAEERFVSRDEVERVRHTLVRRLDHLVK